jgi:hypothetical protein
VDGGWLVVVGAGVDLVTGGGLAAGAESTGGALRVAVASVVGSRPAWFVVVRCAAVLVPGGGAGGGNSGGNAVVAGSEDEVSGLGVASGKPVVCRVLNAVAAMVANPVAIAIPTAAHTTSRCGRASGSS